MILGLIFEAVRAGAGLGAVCKLVGIDRGTPKRWAKNDIGDDRRKGPKSEPGNKYSKEEVSAIIAKVTEPEFRDLSPSQIVPILADREEYVGSESTIRRVLAAADMARHREPSRPRTNHRPHEVIATGPNQAWCWDITYLRSPVHGVYFYLYLVMDVWSRKIVGHAVHDVECGGLAACLLDETCAKEGIRKDQLILHQDNGAPMKSGTFKAALDFLGVHMSFSRPKVSNDNPYVESLFRTLKYRPEFPTKPFQDIVAAAAWVTEFVAWYNTEHRHANIRFVTPEQRHCGEDKAILAKRTAFYEVCRKQNPNRWSRAVRDWSHVEIVELNPASRQKDSEVAA
jgi:putative transposase